MKPVLMSAPPAAAAPPPVADAPRPRVAHKPRAALMWSSLNGLAAVVLPFVVFACFARLMMPRQFAMIGLALAAALPAAVTHFVPGEGHLLLAGNHAKAALQSALRG